MPYKAIQDDVVQFVGSIQLFLTLLAGLILNLQAGTKNAMGPAETSNFGSLLVALNASIFLSTLFSIYMATSSGKNCFKKFITNKNRKSTVQNATRIVPVGKITNGSVMGKARPLKKDELLEIRKKHGAGSIAYKKALQNVGQNLVASSKKK